MISNLHIENYILIDNLDLELSSGLNTITGETGAGKSILLGAISMILGGRCESGIIRKGAKSCIVEATFDVRNLSEELFIILKNSDIDYEEELVVRRVVNHSKSRAFINDIPVTLSLLRDISIYLIDVHSQHQTLLVSNSSFQTNIVDAIGNINWVI